MLELYKNIRKYRKELKMSQEDLAKKVGYNDRSSIAKIENGEVDLPQSKIMSIAKALNVSAGTLMGWDSPMMKAAISAAKIKENAYVNLSASKEEYELINAYRKMNLTEQNMIRRSCGLPPVGESAESFISRSPGDIDRGLDSA